MYYIKNMINYIKGNLVEKNIGNIVVECNGIAYDIDIPQNSNLPNEGEEVLIYTYLAVREDAMNLYGFTNKLDKQMFLKLTSVNGVGPKLGLNIISSLGREELMMAIAKEEKKTISSIKGVGEKTAGRIIVDLKDKLDYSSIKNIDKKEIPSSLLQTSITPKMQNVIDALITLGYQKAKAKDAVLISNLNDEMSEDAMLKIALHNIK